ncbi:MAG: hypothetical protein ACE5HV_01280 [Acidobacteriota bacterium]
MARTVEETITPAVEEPQPQPDKPRPGCEKSPLMPLRRSILLTVLYGDLFDYPMSEDELRRYLVRVSPEPSSSGPPASSCGWPAPSEHRLGAVSGLEAGLSGTQFDDALESLVGPYLSRSAGHYCWKGREHLFELRRQRASLCRRRWPQARRYARWLARVPFVRMVAVCGSQAMENGGEDGDIDIFCITEPRRLWLVQLAAMMLWRVARIFSARICPNYFLTLRSLGLEERNLYTAHEVTQVVPLWGEQAYEAFLAANRWVEDYLPQLDFGDRRRFLEDSPTPATTARLERLLGGGLGDAVDRLIYRMLLVYYPIRLRRRRLSKEDVERAYRRDRQVVIDGGFSTAVARSFKKRVRDRLGEQVPEAVLAGLFPRAASTSVPARSKRSHPVWGRLFARRYGTERRPGFAEADE